MTNPATLATAAAPTGLAATPRLAMRNLGKDYAGTPVLAGVHLELRAGEILGRRERYNGGANIHIDGPNLAQPVTVAPRS